MPPSQSPSLTKSQIGDGVHDYVDLQRLPVALSAEVLLLREVPANGDRLVCHLSVDFQNGHLPEWERWKLTYMFIVSVLQISGDSQHLLGFILGQSFLSKR